MLRVRVVRVSEHAGFEVSHKEHKDTKRTGEETADGPDGADLETDLNDLKDKGDAGAAMGAGACTKVKERTGEPVLAAVGRIAWLG